MKHSEFIQLSKDYFGDLYDYSQVEFEFKSMSRKVPIICKKHGTFYISPRNHLSGIGCEYCKNELYQQHKIEKNIQKTQLSKTEFFSLVSDIHGNAYDYYNTKYKNFYTKINVTCPEHGLFSIYPNLHLKGYGCPLCRNKHIPNIIYPESKEEFIEMSNTIYHNKYDYSEVVYDGLYSKVKIICPENGEFFQMPITHLKGIGWTKHHESSLEYSVRKMCENANIKYIIQKRFDWLTYKNQQFIDFYLCDKNIAIECQGLQHYKNVPLYTKENDFSYIQQRDYNKRNLCKKHGIKIIYYTLEEYKPFIDYNLGLHFTSLDELLTYIKSI